VKQLMQITTIECMDFIEFYFMVKESVFRDNGEVNNIETDSFFTLAGCFLDF